MGQPISEAKKAIFLQRAEARLNFARNLPEGDAKREAKIREAEKALQTALASKTGTVRSGSGRKAGKVRKKRAR
ncbi:hypothetical protein [Reyranella sp.]|uniref:hypothetical protein n=1 Tax=Reyranella sp. TaxID=1929291 RepID=UPI0040355227